jgi:hypothetical protein
MCRVLGTTWDRYTRLHKYPTLPNGRKYCNTAAIILDTECHCSGMSKFFFFCILAFYLLPTFLPPPQTLKDNNTKKRMLTCHWAATENEKQDVCHPSTWQNHFEGSNQHQTKTNMSHRFLPKGNLPWYSENSFQLFLTNWHNRCSHTNSRNLPRVTRRCRCGGRSLLVFFLFFCFFL